MILVDVYVPMLDCRYDFELDEETKTEILIGEVISLIEQKEKLGRKMERDKFFYDLERERMLKWNENLVQQGVKSGDRLVLV